MLHCLPFFSAGFSLAGPASHVKLHSAPAPLSRSSIPFAAAAAAGDVDEVELRFRDLEVTKERAPEVLALMEEHSFPLGLAQRAIESAKTFPVRFWVVDNSGSMGYDDGQRLAQDSTGKFKVVQSTRWQELTQDIEAAASLSHLIGARTEFYLLNPVGAKPIIVTGKRGELEVLKAGLGQPRDRTPLAQTTERIVDKVMDLAPSLLACGEKACVVIATDGKPTDGEDAFQRAVERLLKLPVFLVFRLCTNDEDVIDYYNELDAQRAMAACQTNGQTNILFEKGVEVIDDLYGEALEIKNAGNTWLTYGPPMQLARYFGMKDQVFDLIDQSKLLPSQIKIMCEALLGCINLPDPDVDPKAFIAAVDEQVALHPKVFDPPSGKMQPWIKTDVLKSRLK